MSDVKPEHLKLRNMGYGESSEVVVCERDGQPHYLNGHGDRPCVNPYVWTKKGLSDDDIPLEF